MNESLPKPLINELHTLKKGEKVTVVTARFGVGLQFADHRHDGIFPHVNLPLTYIVDEIEGERFSSHGQYVFAGSAEGIESIIAYLKGDENEPRVVFHNPNIRNRYTRPYRHSLCSPEGIEENIQRKVDMGLGSEDDIREATEKV